MRRVDVILILTFMLLVASCSESGNNSKQYKGDSNHNSESTFSTDDNLDNSIGNTTTEDIASSIDNSSNDVKNPPTASIVFSYRDALVNEPLSAILYASEDIYGIDESDFKVSGATLKSWQMVTPKLYRLILLPLSNSDEVSIIIDKNAACDSDGNSLKKSIEAKASIAKAPWSKQIRRYRGIIDAVLEYQNSSGDKATIDMIWIRPGSYKMGCSRADDKHCDSDETIHQVTLTKGFWISRREVTQYQWSVAMGGNPSYFQATSIEEQQKLPLENISYNDAISFTKKISQNYKINMTLPTEAQWEYACRSSTTTAYYDNYDDIKGDANSKAAYYIGWYAGNSSEWNYKKTTQPIPSKAIDLSDKYNNFYKKVSNSFATHYIGEKAGSDWRLQDMSGNVAEWCLDWYTSNLTTKAQIDPKGPNSGTKKVVKGGSWYDGASMLRSSSREGVSPSTKSYRIGLRVVILPSKDIK